MCVGVGGWVTHRDGLKKIMRITGEKRGAAGAGKATDTRMSDREQKVGYSI